jgi:N-acetylglucosamine kinase-like BadF-type ATPase
VELALGIVSLLNAAAPGIASLVMLIRRKDGTITVGVLLDEAETTFNNNIAQAAAWFKEHPVETKPEVKK